VLEIESPNLTIQIEKMLYLNLKKVHQLKIETMFCIVEVEPRFLDGRKRSRMY